MIKKYHILLFSTQLSEIISWKILQKSTEYRIVPTKLQKDLSEI